jgi:hypothetical protein
MCPDADTAVQLVSGALIERQNRLSVHDHTEAAGSLADHLDGRLDRSAGGAHFAAFGAARVVPPADG